MISTHIRTEGLYVKTTLIYQLKRLCVPDCAYTKNMFINSIHISLYDISLTQNILYQIKRCGCMEETRMPPAYSANQVANSGNTIYHVYGVSVNYALSRYDGSFWTLITQLVGHMTEIWSRQAKGPCRKGLSIQTPWCQCKIQIKNCKHAWMHLFTQK